jgi:REP element-mobilizing transposase RayT
MQQNLIPKEQLRYVKAWTHGGQKLKKRRKLQRPLLPNKVTHVVFKSSKAKGALSFYSQKIKVKNRLQERAKKYHILIQDFVNMGNHLHLKVKFKDPSRFKNFLRTFAALLARDLTKASKSNKFGRFWDGLVYTRVLHSSFEELGIRGYFEGNHRQRELGYQARVSYLNQFNDYLRKLKNTKAEEKEISSMVMMLSG